VCCSAASSLPAPQAAPASLPPFPPTHPRTRAEPHIFAAPPPNTEREQRSPPCPDARRYRRVCEVRCLQQEPSALRRRCGRRQQTACTLSEHFATRSVVKQDHLLLPPPPPPSRTESSTRQLPPPRPQSVKPYLQKPCSEQPFPRLPQPFRWLLPHLSVCLFLSFYAVSSARRRCRVVVPQACSEGPVRDSFLPCLDVSLTLGNRYHGKGIGTGNTVSFAENKGRRTWKPNVSQHCAPLHAAASFFGLTKGPGTLGQALERNSANLRPRPRYGSSPQVH
jgi:hypothetical protein